MAIKLKGWILNPLLHRRNKHTMSTIFRPTNPQLPQQQKKKDPSADTSKSQRLMIDNGLIRSSSTGLSYHLLPIAMKSLNKLVSIIDKVLDDYSCQKILMPTMTPASLWKTTGRLEECGSEIFMLNDRHNKPYILSPTHEEAICDLLREYSWSYKHLPLRLYQITSKFRDEMKPRFGLLRSREFIMKDLYTFDVDESAALKTYEEINEAYKKIFDYIGVKYMKVEGTTGVIGGSVSHEYHLLASIGEDQIISCSKCGASFNEQLITGDEERSVEIKDHYCIKCSSKDVHSHTGIEVGHTFLLGKKYTNALKTSFVDSSGKREIMNMGCYGIGVTRLLAGVLESLSTETQIRWPVSLVPYFAAIIPPKSGSKEEQIGQNLTAILDTYLNQIFPNDTIIDDRTNMTIGKRLSDIQSLGIPYAFILGKGVNETVPLIELHNVYQGDSISLTLEELQDYISTLKNNDHLKDFSNGKLETKERLESCEEHFYNT